MSDTPPVDTTTPSPRRSVARHAVSVVTWLLALLVVAIAAGWFALGTQAALDYVVQRAIDESKGQLTIEGATGSLLSTIRVRRIAWHGPDMDVEASEIAMTWSPLDLVSRRFHVQGLGAQRLALHFKGGSKQASGLPASLALPLEVSVSNIGVQRLEWQTGETSGVVTGVTFDYTGGAREHTVRKLRLVSEYGTLTGDARLAAEAPYTLAGTLAMTGDGPYRDGQATLNVEGTLERIALAAKGTLRNANGTVKASLTPFTNPPLVSADVDASDVDLAQFAPALPATALTLNLTARPAGSGFAGSLTARNANAGPLDAGRIPVAALTSAFAWEGGVLALTGARAELPGGGRAAGDIRIPFNGAPVALQLTLNDVDLARILSTLVATRLSGSVTADVTQDRQVVRGDIRQGDLAVAFAGTVANRRVTLDRARVQAGAGELNGSGTFAFDAPRAFTLNAKATRFDPSRFVAMPPAKLDGTVDVRGTLKPAFDVTGEVTVARGSELAGLALAGRARGHVTPTAARDMTLEASLGSAKLNASGAFGSPTDALAFAADVPHLEELAPLLARYASVTVPAKSAGALRANGTLRGDPAAPALTLALTARGLQWGDLVRVATLDVDADAPAPLAGKSAPKLAARPVTLRIAATGVHAAQRDLATVKATVDGTLAQHRATLAFTGQDVDVAASFAGGVAEVTRAGAPATNAWQGTLDTLVNKGPYAFKLEAPAKVSLASDRIEIGDARVTAALGRAELVRLVVDHGRISTQGSFTGISAAAVAQFAGTPLPFPSTLLLGGDWSLSATPRLNGTFAVRRESGDWFGSDSPTLAQKDVALGISALELTGTFTDDALRAAARFRSLRAGTADATLTLAAGSAPGRLDAKAPLAATLTADLESLRPMQPWLGTLAVMDGRAHLALAVRGTLADPEIGGTLAGDALRFDLPQYGVHLRDGMLRARLADRTIFLDDFTFAGGAGKFSAKGTLARAPGTGNATSRIEWTANDFTVVNRPDLQIIADGTGSVAVADKKLLLSGKISIDKGRVIYEPSRVGTLSDDVVIVGQPRATADAGRGGLPLALDLQVALGRDFRFSGEGLETRLGGNVHVVTTADGTLTGRGTIYAVGGTYYVFGQRLDIDRGRVIFDGPLNNPALDVVALRKNLAVEAGVEVTGTVKVPRVRLVSNPPVPDGEKLSWLLTGQGLDRANRADLAALSAASASLLGQGNRPITQQIANTFGLDDISVRDSANAVAGGASTQVVAFGKRISDRLTLVYEQGLSVANNALRIEYALSRAWTLRAEAGVVSSIGIYFRRSYE